MTDLTDLIARVEAGKGTDAPLNEHALRIFGWTEDGGHAYRPDGSRALHIPDLMTSLNAVLSMMPPECFWQLGHDGDGPDPSKFKARVFNPMKMRGPCVSVTDDCVRALLAAILRAKEAGHA